MSEKPSYWIKHLNLEPHPEGGYFHEIYRNTNEISDVELNQKYSGKRSLATSIYFMLESGQVSKLHRLKSDEIWYFHHGAPLTVHVFNESKYHVYTMGIDMQAGHLLQLIIPAGAIFGAEVVNPNSFSLTSCMVTPGFHFDDFEMISYNEVIRHFASYESIIRKLT